MGCNNTKKSGRIKACKKAKQSKAIEQTMINEINASKGSNADNTIMASKTSNRVGGRAGAHQGGFQDQG